MIEHRPVAIRHGRELVEELGEHLRVVRLHLDQALHLRRFVVVVRQRMERVGHADVVVGLAADLGRHHEGEDARHVRLIRQRDQVEHQVDVLIEGRRAQRRVRDVDVRQVASLRLLNAALDFADGLEIVGQHPLVGRPQAALQRR